MVRTIYQTCLLGIAFLASFTCAAVAARPAAAQTAAAEALAKAESLMDRDEYKSAAKLALEAAELDTKSFRVQQLAAELVYLSGQAEESLPLFDRAVKLAPRLAAENWQRGIALATCGKFAEAAKQFETHHRVNPDDVENSAWYFLCIAKSDDLAAARKTVIPSRGDSRQPMMSVLEMLKGQMKPEEVIKVGSENSQADARLNRAEFYAALYVGLYYDSLGDKAQAIKYLKRSLEYEGRGYMARTAHVYLAGRFAKDNKEITDAGR